MRSRMSSQYLQSPTVVQSPVSQAPSSRRSSFPVTPVLDMRMEDVPFSKSFPGIMRTPTAEYDSQLLCAQSGANSHGKMSADESFNIHRIINVKSVDPHWHDEEIDEIMVISPKARHRTSFMDLDAMSDAGMSDFDVLRIIGKGSSAQTLLARRNSDASLFAIKTTRKHRAAKSETLKHLRSEQACLKSVTQADCPFLPKLHQSFQDNTRLYLVMPIYPGGSIALHLLREGPFGPDKARFYASETVEALSYLHSLSIVHRDVKADNIMIAQDGHIVLSGFECAKKLDELGSPEYGTASNCGTHEYQAPEMIMGWRYDFAVDCWGFGIFLCIMHFGQHPFLDGDELDPLLIMQKRIVRGQTPLHPLQSVPLSEWGLIKKCLERNPRLRPTMEDIKGHEYFSEIDWMKVECKEYPVPYLPSVYGDEVDLLHVDEEIFHRYEQSDLLDLDDMPLDNVAENAFDGYSFTWTPEDGPSDVEYFGKPFQENSSKHANSPVIRNIRSILKSPSLRFQEHSALGDTALKHTDFLDLNRSGTHLGIFETPDRPRKLRKKRSSRVPGIESRNSTLTNRKSMVSLFSLSSTKNLKVAESTSPHRLPNYETSVSSCTVNLPKGVVQSGKGIGFTYTPPASRSHLSLASVASSSCFAKLGNLLHRLGKSTENLPKSRADVMQQIYGSTWSISQTEARMSAVTFGIPDGLGRRVDSNDNLPEAANVNST